MLKMEIPVNLIQIVMLSLSNRTFSVKIEDHSSTSHPVVAGVLQYSCLVPLLYLICTNDIPSTEKACISLFSDDMFYSANNNAIIAILQFQRQINIATDWFEKWRIRINTSKTTAVLFSYKRTSNLRQFTLNSSLIIWSNQVKYLSVKIDQNLNFNQQIINIRKKETQTRGILYPIFNNNNPVLLKTRINIFKLYIRPIITYVGAAWAPFISCTNWRKI